MDVLQTQYSLIWESRAVVFNYLKTFSKQDLDKPVSEFNQKSILNLFTHIANVYIHWISKYALKKEIEYFSEEEVKTVDDLRAIFDRVNLEMDIFISNFGYGPRRPLKNTIAGVNYSSTPIQIYTHVVTHEFHHKGQIMSMGRLLGYPPPDADVVRF